MPKNATDRNLLFGILAVQMDFIRRDALMAAMNAWVLDKTKTLGQVLLEQKALTPDTHALMEALVQKHLEMHGNDVEKSIAAVSSIGPLRQELEGIADPDVTASVANVAKDATRDHDPGPTIKLGAGAMTSKGVRFRILRPHAKGGLGVVFVAHDEELSRDVALKEIQERHADSDESRNRFMLEAEITGGLEHPGIVPVYGLGQYADGRPFYAMRFIRGDSLKEAISKFHANGGVLDERSVEFRELLERLIDVCNAIQYAHDRGVLHRDLKPGNIMLGKYGETLVVDWGLAKPMGKPGDAVESSQRTNEPVLSPASHSGTADTIQGSAIGTPQYMSPEQAAGNLEKMGPACDIYSLGATLYCILTGKSPVDDSGVDNQRKADLNKILQKVQKGEITPPRKHKPDLDLALEAICLKAMALKPEDRYASPTAMVDDLKHWLADEPVTAWPDPWTVKTRRWVGKHKTLVTGTAAALLVGLVSLTMATVLLAQKNELIQKKNDDLTDANVRIKQEVDEKEKQRKLAEFRLRQSLDAVGLFANDARKYCEDAMVPGDSRRRLYEVLTTQLERQVDQESGEATIDVLYNKLWMYQTLCSVNIDIGDYPKSKEWFAKGLKTVEQWKKVRPDDPQAQGFHATLLHLRGTALELDRKLADAKVFFAEALEIRRKLVGNPDVDLSAKVDAITKLADSLDSLEQFPESLILREKIVRTFEKDEAKAPKDKKLRERSYPYREAWSWTYMKAGLHATDYETRKKYLKQADEMSAELEPERSSNRNLLLRWATIAKMYGELEYNYGKLAEKDGKKEEAEKYFADAKVYYKKLNEISRKLATSREMIEGVRDYSRSFYTLGLVEHRKGNPTKARDHFEMSRKIREQAMHDYRSSAHSAHLQIDQYFSLVALGELRDTIEQADNMIFTFVEEPDAEYRLACVYALAIETIADIRKPEPLTPQDKGMQKRFRNEALKCLQLAHDGGFSDFFQTNIDADLDAIRDDSRMKEFEASHIYRLGVLEKKQGDAKKAQAHFEKAQNLNQEWLKELPTEDRESLVKIDWLCARFQLGHHAETIKSADELRPKLQAAKYATARYLPLFRLARVYALASVAEKDVKLQEEYRVKAFAILHQVADLNRKAGKRIGQHLLMTADDLESLRADPRFQQTVDLYEGKKK